MIVFETALRSIFEQLPTMEDAAQNVFKPRFMWGTEDVLNKFIALPENVSKYPLIWLVNGSDSQSLKNDKVERDARLVLAKSSETPNEFNDFIFDTEYNLILNPLLENVLKALNRANNSKIVGEDYKVERLVNYSQTTNENKTLAIWNVIILDCKIRLNGNKCINKISF